MDTNKQQWLIEFSDKLKDELEMDDKTFAETFPSQVLDEIYYDAITIGYNPKEMANEIYYVYSGGVFENETSY